jgi:eukaryotic-like serine/threonine-protein kinase
MGEVWLARQVVPAGQGGSVAVKMVLPHLAASPEFVSLLRREAEQALRLRHPAIVRTHGLEEAEGSVLLVMEHVPGPSLRWVLERSRASGRRLPAGFAAHAVALVCEALHYAHTLTNEQGQPAGLVHGDVSADNVLVTPSGALKVVDFGLTRPLAASAGAPRMGKRAYVAPEVLAGKAPHARGDIYAAGVLLSELAAASEPDAEVEALARWALAPEEAARPETAQALREALLPLAARAGFDPSRAGALVAALLTSEPARKEGPMGATTTGTLSPEPAPIQTAPERRRGRWERSALGVLLASALLGALWLALTR